MIRYTWIEDQPNVSAVNRKIRAAVVSFAVAPIHDAIVFGVNRRFHDAIRNTGPSRFPKLTGAAAGVALRQNAAVVLFQD